MPKNQKLKVLPYKFLYLNFIPIKEALGFPVF